MKHPLLSSGELPVTLLQVQVSTCHLSPFLILTLSLCTELTQREVLSRNQMFLL